MQTINQNEVFLVFIKFIMATLNNGAVESFFDQICRKCLLSQTAKDNNKKTPQYQKRKFEKKRKSAMKKKRAIEHDKQVLLKQYPVFICRANFHLL
jgi:hypothetical protein